MSTHMARIHPAPVVLQRSWGSLDTSRPCISHIFVHAHSMSVTSILTRSLRFICDDTTWTVFSATNGQGNVLGRACPSGAGRRQLKSSCSSSWRSTASCCRNLSMKCTSCDFETADEISTRTLIEEKRCADRHRSAVKKKIDSLSSNAQKQVSATNPWRIKHSLGVDFGDSRTGLAISLRGFAPRPLNVLQMRGDNLVAHLVQVAMDERADELIVGLPKSLDGKETFQSKKTRSFAGRLASQAALRGVRVYLMDEYGTSREGLEYMLDMGMRKRARKEMLDAYAAVALLQVYFSSGDKAQLVVPKDLTLQELLCAEELPLVEEDCFDDVDYY